MTSSFNWQSPNTQDATLSYYLDTPAGQLILSMQGEILCNTVWLITAPAEQTCQALPKELHQQIFACWLDTAADMPLPLLPQGTPFQQTVWLALCEIPTGTTKTYGELASELNTSPRALANACRKNPFPLIIPCHRVIAKTGIGGYAGHTSGKLLEIKTALLHYEKKLTHAR